MQKEQNMSIPDQRWTVHLTWSPGAYKLPTAPGGSWRRDVPGWEKAENKFTATSGLRVCACVSCVAYIYSRVCSSVSCVPLKPDKLFSLSFWSISCKMPGCAHDANVLRQSTLFSQAHLLPKVSPTVLSRHINVWIKSVRSYK